MDLRQIKVSDDDFGLMTYDPAFQNTASTSSITFIDGDKGILEYRGYPIEQLAEKASFLEVVWLLLNGELPNSKQLEGFRNQVTMHTMVHENMREFIDGFRYDAHPMGILLSTVGALSTFYPDAKNVDDPAVRRQMIAHHREDADARGLCVPPPPRPADTSTRTTTSATRATS
jgi:citrate synthase